MKVCGEGVWQGCVVKVCGEGVCCEEGGMC